MTNEDRLTPDAIAALRDRFQLQSRKAQAYYTVMNEIRGLLRDDDAANAWMNQALEVFDGMTPAQLVAEGRELDILAHVKVLKRGA